MVAEHKDPLHVNVTPDSAGDRNKLGAHPANVEKATEPEEPFSVFSRSEKWLIVSLTALAGLFR